MGRTKIFQNRGDKDFGGSVCVTTKITKYERKSTKTEKDFYPGGEERGKYINYLVA